MKEKGFGGRVLVLEGHEGEEGRGGALNGFLKSIGRIPIAADKKRHEGGRMKKTRQNPERSSAPTEVGEQWMVFRGAVPV